MTFQKSRSLRLDVEDKYDADDHVPDYLLNSPFLPPGSTTDRFFTDRAVAPPRFRLRQLLHLPWRRRILPLTLLATILFLLTRSLNERLQQYLHPVPSCALQAPLVPPSPAEVAERGKDVDWGKMAYALYVTNTEYLCNALMIFEALHRLGSKASRVMLYPEGMSMITPSAESNLLQKARHDFGVRLVPVKIQERQDQFKIWASSYTKLLTFNQTSYSRLLVLDSDATLLQPMDELFFLPSNSTPAFPQAYWLPRPYLTSSMMLITPNSNTSALLDSAVANAKPGVFDMEIVNSMFGDSCNLIPHRGYTLLSGEFRRKAEKHRGYYSQLKYSMIPQSLPKPSSISDSEWDAKQVIKQNWDPDAELKLAKYVHFSDDPFPKPWIRPTDREKEKFQPKCVPIASTQGTASNEEKHAEDEEDCRARDIWLNLYDDFAKRRLGICGFRISS
ncbi:nucleotide-diphospho-sugar transferase [Bisporella sp. PMI_857]|nr:nucleotide-diphospho-sugar transferase [Bisporella sp. PMI_857]